MMRIAKLFFATTMACVAHGQQSIVDIASADPDQFGTLVAALSAADLVDTLAGEGTFTVFAPTNEAFAALPAGALDSLLLAENKAQLTEVLLYHVLGSVVRSKDLSDGLKAETLQGGSVTATIMGTSPFLRLKINGANVIQADVAASNGVIHVIDAVLQPSQSTLPSIVDIATADPDQFGTLVAALSAADLVDTLAGEGTFTVFAPTNEAFAALPAGALDSLLLTENKAQLTEVLLYHVLGSVVRSKDLSDGLKANTLQGNTVMATVKGVLPLVLRLQVNDANIIQSDIEASNGVVHAIDAVLLPPVVGDSTQDDDGRNIPAIVLPILFGVAIIAAVSFYVVRRKQESKNAADLADTENEKSRGYVAPEQP